jgi:hypothetical protein
MAKSTWSNNPTTNQWNESNNWDPASMPTKVASFKDSSQTSIALTATSADQLDCIEFEAGAPPYLFSLASSAKPATNYPMLTISGQGVINNSASPQSFVVAASSVGHDYPQLQFLNSASAGGADVLYTSGPVTRKAAGGGVINFCNKSSAGSASFKVWTGAGQPVEPSTVGGEVSFQDSASAESARFTIYGTLGKDGDTFGNVVFHNSATAANGTFTNAGGTVSGGDGGNTQLYDTSTAANGVFHNLGGTVAKSNGGDVAFDGVADGGNAYFYNYPATAAKGFGGVTSFNNNPPEVDSGGASAGHGYFFNYGAREAGQGGGGHTEFTAKHGSPTAANGSFFNYGTAVPYSSASSAGHTIFSVSLGGYSKKKGSQAPAYFPTAGDATFWNLPAQVEGAVAGFTEFSVYSAEDSWSKSKTKSPRPRPASSNSVGPAPTAGNGTFNNQGANVPSALGGYTSFSGTASAGSAHLVSIGGTNGGDGGRIVFYGDSIGGAATVQLFGNGVLAVDEHTGGLTFAVLDLTGGIISVQLGATVTSISLSEGLILKSGVASFTFLTYKKKKPAFNTPYTILTAPNLSSFTAAQFSGNALDKIPPTFTISGNNLEVSFNKR